MFFLSEISSYCLDRKYILARVSNVPSNYWGGRSIRKLCRAGHLYGYRINYGSPGAGFVFTAVTPPGMDDADTASAPAEGGRSRKMQKLVGRNSSSFPDTRKGPPDPGLHHHLPLDAGAFISGASVPGLCIESMQARTDTSWMEQQRIAFLVRRYGTVSGLR